MQLDVNFFLNFQQDVGDVCWGGASMLLQLFPTPEHEQLLQAVCYSVVQVDV
jgi:hypothetical protein